MVTSASAWPEFGWTLKTPWASEKAEGVGTRDGHLQPSRLDEGEDVAERSGTPRSRLGHVHLDSGVRGVEGHE
ncbi:hypothetical protein [Streptomyces sp. F001]|uniref:hypothetical protein n=1 Tax=Streptomyces sp. F001 TaxID=1510026 RepID=UPI001F0FD4C6|nr:hypothetical protein [Streptomyces sp. F001]